MKRLFAIICAACLTIAVYAQSPLKFWGVDLSTASVRKVERAIKKRGYIKTETSASGILYSNTFYGLESHVLIRRNGDTNKIKFVSFLAYSEDFSNVVKLGDILYEQLKDSHPDFTLTEEPRKGSMYWMFNTFTRGPQSVAIAIPKERNKDKKYYVNVLYTVIRDSAEGF